MAGSSQRIQRATKRTRTNNYVQKTGVDDLLEAGSVFIPACKKQGRGQKVYISGGCHLANCIHAVLIDVDLRDKHTGCKQ